jgi:hypothetical protein
MRTCLAHAVFATCITSITLALFCLCHCIPDNFRSQDGALQLQHNPSGVMFSVLESDVQSGRAVVHVVDNIIPAAALVNVTVPQPGIGRFYSSAMDVLFDPRRQLSSFAGLVNNAGLTELLSDPSAELTLFAPSDAVRYCHTGTAVLLHPVCIYCVAFHRILPP